MKGVPYHITRGKLSPNNIQVLQCLVAKLLILLSAVGSYFYSQPFVVIIFYNCCLIFRYKAVEPHSVDFFTITAASRPAERLEYRVCTKKEHFKSLTEIKTNRLFTDRDARKQLTEKNNYRETYTYKPYYHKRVQNVVETRRRSIRQATN